MQTTEIKKDYAVAVLDPAGNVTALVLSDVPAAERVQGRGASAASAGAAH